MQTISIGRDASNNIVLNDNMVSRNHAHLILTGDGRALIKDLGSTNGTYVNGIRINESFLKSGDVVKCANVFFNWQFYIPSPDPQSYNTASEKNQYQSYDSSKEPNKHENRLFISSSISDNLPAMVKNELASLSAQKQQEFVEEYKRKKKSVVVAYILMLPLFFVIHYAYLRKWGLQFLFWFTLGGFGVWYLIDLFRTYGLVQDYNKDVAVDVIRNLKAISK